MKDGYIRVAAASPDLRVADCAYNAQCIIDTAHNAAAEGVKLLALPELCVTGYTCGDLFFQPMLQNAALAALQAIADATKELDMLLLAGLPLPVQGKLYNCAAVLHRGKALGFVPKTHLPHGGEYKEPRWFTPAFDGMRSFSPPQGAGQGFSGAPVGRQLFHCRAEDALSFTFAVEIGGDLWAPAPLSARYAAQGAEVIVGLSASSELAEKARRRRDMVAAHSARLLCGYIYAAAGSGESTTDLVFAGHNMIAENGTVLCETPPFGASPIAISELDIQALRFRRQSTGGFFAAAPEETHTVTCSLQSAATPLSRTISSHPFVPEGIIERRQRCETVLSIQAHGLARRLVHTGAARLILGLSGGQDSTLAFLVALRALGLLGRPSKDLLAITLPCFGTTSRTRGNAEKLALAAGAAFKTIDITKTVTQHFADISHSPDNTNTVYENAQARIRTLVLMDLANQQNGLVVGTGDLSELALGWTTYNGDHMSMYNVNASVPKTLIRHLILHEAEIQPALRDVLQDILDTPISPELLPALGDKNPQETEQSIGPYELHDFALYHMLRRGASPAKILRIAEVAFAGHYRREEIKKWLFLFCRRFFSQQFKRSCMPDGPKVGSVSLSPRGDWQMPSDAAAALWLKELEG